MPPLSILVDALSAREGGGVTYIDNILPSLLEQRANVQLYVLLSLVYQQELADGLPDDVIVIDAGIRPSLMARLRYLDSRVPALVNEHRISVLFSVSEMTSARPGCPSVAMVRNGNLFAPWSVLSLKWRLLRAPRRLLVQPIVRRRLLRVTLLVFVSDSLRQSVLPRLGLAENTGAVIHHGRNPLFNDRNLAPESSGSPYLLTVSTVMPHKNYETLIDALGRLVAQDPRNELQLLIAGALGSKSTYRDLQRRIEALSLEDRVRFLGRVATDDLVRLYQGALLFVFPSKLESFGHPLVEAMACGTPIVASDLPVAKEICSDAASYFSPNDSAALASLIMELRNDASRRKVMTAKGLLRASRFSWKRAAGELLEVLEALSGAQMGKARGPTVDQG